VSNVCRDYEVTSEMHRVVQKDVYIFYKVAFYIERKTLQFFRPVSQTCTFCVILFFPRTLPFCEHIAIVYDVLDPSSLSLNHCEYSHIEVCNDPVQHLMENFPKLHKYVILERINLRIVSISMSFK